MLTRICGIFSIERTSSSRKFCYPYTPPTKNVQNKNVILTSFGWFQNITRPRNTFSLLKLSGDRIYIYTAKKTDPVADLSSFVHNISETVPLTLRAKCISHMEI